jgi:hypothetical protein
LRPSMATSWLFQLDLPPPHFFLLRVSLFCHPPSLYAQAQMSSSSVRSLVAEDSSLFKKRKVRLHRLEEDRVGGKRGGDGGGVGLGLGLGLGLGFGLGLG